MPKIVFCFAGTGDEGEKFAKGIEDTNDFGNDVIRIYLRGCEHDNVGGGMIFPDLEVVSNKILKAFNQSDKTIDINKLKSELGGAICRIEGPVPTQTGITKTEITNIGLQGFSRGAVATFAVAKKLDVLGIPMDIIANQPVPGQIAENTPGSLFAKYHDLSKCKNIRSATTLLATHNLENGFLHNTFFQQMVARFPESVKANTWLMPYQEHSKSNYTPPVPANPPGKAAVPLKRPDPSELPLVPLHIRDQFETSGYTSVNEMDRGFNRVLIKNLHKKNELYFTPPEFSQKVFGADLASMSKDPVYLELMQESARTILKGLDVKLSDDQASAIVIISRLGVMLSPEQKDKFMNLALQNNDNGKKFTQIINKTDGVISFLRGTTAGNQKTSSIYEHSFQYKKDIFNASYDYLSNPEPSEKDKTTFIKAIDSANKTLDDKALKIDRNMGRKAMQIITTFLLTITGVGMIANAINLAQTGNWSFFSNTRSSQVASAFSKEVVAHVTTEDRIDKANNIKEQLGRLRASAQVKSDPKPEEAPPLAPAITPK